MAEPITPEGRVKSAIIKILKQYGWGVEINVQGPYTRGFAGRSNAALGRPDITASKRGLSIRVEVKRPACRSKDGRWLQEGRLSESQLKYIRWLNSYGIKVFVTSDTEEFVRELEDLEERLWPGRNQKKLF